MDKIVFMGFVEEVLELTKGSVNLSTNLNTLPQWDSMGKLSLIVEVSQKFNKKLTNDILKSFIIIEDIFNFIKQ
jgi:acyl carrier protein